MEKLIKAMKGEHLVFAQVFTGDEHPIPPGIEYTSVVIFIKGEDGEWVEQAEPETGGEQDE